MNAAYTTLRARSSPFEGVFSFGERHGPPLLVFCLMIATGVHGALGAALSDRQSQRETRVVEVVDLDLRPPPPETPPPEPPPPAPNPTPSPVAASPAAPPEAKPTKEPPPPAAAKAGHLLVAPDDPKAQKSDTPYEFVTDPDGKEYGSGTVAKGGTADFGVAGAVASGVPGGTGTGSAVKGPPAPPPPKPTADLTRKPLLLDTDCRNTFPQDADDDFGQVQVLVTVKASGEVSNATVLSESPRGQGFGRQARTCLLAKRFSPGLDREGKATQSTQTVRITYTRN